MKTTKRGMKALAIVMIMAMVMSVIPIAVYADVSGNTGGTKIREYKVVLNQVDTTAEKVPIDTDMDAYIAEKKVAFESQYNVLKNPEYNYGEEHMTIPDISSLFTEDSYAIFRDTANDIQFQASEDLIAIGDIYNDWDNVEVAQGKLVRTDKVTVEYDVVTVSLQDPRICTITFDANGGTVDTTSMITEATGKLASLPNPTREGYSFDGWYTAAVDGTKVTTDMVFDTDATVFAHWTEVTVETPQTTTQATKTQTPQKTTTPKTGDSAGTLLITLLLASGTGIAMMTRNSKKRKVTK